MPNVITVSILCPLPGTESFRIMKERNLLPNKQDWSKYTFFNNKLPYKRLTHITSKELNELQMKMLKEYYTNPKYMIIQILKIRTVNEFLYFYNMGTAFIKDFFIKK